MSRRVDNSGETVAQEAIDGSSSHSNNTPTPPSHNRQTSSSSHRSHRSRGGGRRRKRGSDQSDADAQKKAELREQRRAQSSGIVISQNDEMDGGGAMIGDELSSANVRSVPLTTMNRNQSSGSRSHGSRGGHSRPTKAKHGPTAQVGAVATTGRAYGAAPRRNDTNNITQSIVGNAPLLSQEEIDELTPKEAMAMNVQTVEDHEADKKREKRRQQKLQEEKKRLYQDAANDKKKKAAPMSNVVLVAIPDEDLGKIQNNHDGTDDDGDDDSTDSTSSNKRIMIIIGALVLLIAACCGAYFFTKGKAEEAAIPVVVVPNTPAPTVPLPITPGPTPNPSTTPSLVPTLPLPKYEPPSPEDCQALSNGLAVEGQEDMVVRKFQIILNVYLTFNTNSGEVATDLKLSIQEDIVPELAGCRLPSRRRNKNRKLQQPQRPLPVEDGSEEFRFLIGNSNVTRVRDTGNGCPSLDRPCYEMEALMDVFLKDREDNIHVIHNLDRGFDNLVDKLGVRLFDEIDVQDIVNIQPTPSPTVALTMAPVNNSSAVPSESPSTSPSLIPTVTPGDPTASPSMSPSASPTKIPSKNLTMSPTERPTKNPTKNPTPSPVSPSPTAKPTEWEDNDNDNDSGSEVCLEDLALMGDDIDFFGYDYDIAVRIPCFGTNPIVAYAEADGGSCGGTCLGILEIRDRRPCDERGSFPIVMPGDYSNQVVAVFQSKTATVSDSCPTSKILRYDPQQMCDNDPAFVDSAGNMCSYYNRYGPLACPDSADELYNWDGLSAFDSCCNCGGGFLKRREHQ
ncbi:MAG: hypothetical protein SGBAC_004094 [Bacillariaceae sp.]